MSVESSVSLREKLETYSEQLSQLEEYLKDDPTNEEVLKARLDVQDIITLTNTLLKTSLEREKAAAATPSLPANVLNAVPAMRTVLMQQQGVKIVPIFQIGQRVMAKYSDGKYYEAKVEKVPTYAGEKYTVSYLGYNETAELGSDEITTIGVSSKKHKREEEQEQTNSGEVKPEFVIPKSLRILPTDPEEIQKSKKRKIHAIKNQNRMKKQEEERNASKTSWQTFVTKNTGVSKSSIFRSPDSISGKVGVMNSGSYLTPQPLFKVATVKRWRKNEQGEDVEVSDEEQEQPQED